MAPATTTKKATTKGRTTKAQKALTNVIEILGEEEPPVTAAAPAPKKRRSRATKDGMQPVARPNGEDYHPRAVAGMADVEVLRTARAQGICVLLAGFPGSGKTAMIEAAFGEELVTLAAHGDLEVADLIGGYTQQPDGRYRWVDGPLTIAMREGRPLFIDEITLAPAPVLARLYPAMDGRGEIRITEHEGETVQAQPGFWVVGAHNPGAPGAVLSEALASRFLMPIDVITDLTMATRLGVDRRIVRAATNLHRQREQGAVMWAPEMRELLAYKRVCDVFGEGVAVANLVGAAPEDARDALVDVLRVAFPGVEPLKIG